MQHDEWLSLFLTLVLIVLWVEAREGETSEPQLACAPGAGDRVVVSHPSGSSARRCGYGAVGHLSDASSHYPVDRVP